MCDAGATAVIGLSLAATAALAQGAQSIAQNNTQQNYYKAQAQQRQMQILENYRNAKQDFLQQGNTLRQQQSERQEATATEVQKLNRQQLQQRGAATAAAAEAGVQGISVEGLLNDFQRQQALSTEVLRRNQTLADRQISRQMLGLEAQARDRSQSVQPLIVPGNSIINTIAPIVGTAAQVGGYAAQGYDFTKALDDPNYHSFYGYNFKPGD